VWATTLPFFSWRAKMKQWIDPPSGWRYGFPKIWSGEGDVMEWLISQGYPQREIDSLGDYFFTRSWVPTEEEIANHYNPI
jgi:hypothetical protein